MKTEEGKKFVVGKNKPTTILVVASIIRCVNIVQRASPSPLPMVFDFIRP